MSVQVRESKRGQKWLDVSIHPMCRFKEDELKKFEGVYRRFNTSYVSVQGEFYGIRHLKEGRFQYILCVGSRWF